MSHYSTCLGIEYKLTNVMYRLLLALWVIVPGKPQLSLFFTILNIDRKSTDISRTTNLQVGV